MIEYNRLYKLITKRYDYTCEMVALLKAYYSHGNSQKAVWKYDEYYDSFVDEIINTISEFVEREHKVRNGDAHFIKFFKEELKDTYWLHYIPQLVYDDYTSNPDKSYLNDIQFDLIKLDWIYDVYHREGEYNKDFRDFVNSFNI